MSAACPVLAVTCHQLGLITVVPRASKPDEWMMLQSAVPTIAPFVRLDRIDEKALIRVSEISADAERVGFQHSW